jgi:hypothetical protein
MNLIAKIMSIVLVVGVIVFGSCKKSNDTTIEPPNGNPPCATCPTNLIANSSFESDSNFTLAMWNKWLNDTTYINSSTDIPPSGGTFSVRVRGTGMPLLISGSISYTVSLPAGTHRYRLAVWGKGYGMANISLRPGFPAPYDTKSLGFSDTNAWVELSMLDTLTTTSSDSVHIVLGPNLSFARSPWNILFDLCRFEQLD